MPYQIDPHCHSWFSIDGVSSPESLIASARRKGLHGFALTDHDTSDGCRYLIDQGLLREDGQPVDDFLVIPGVEVSTAEGHLLCLGVFLPYLKGAPAREVCQIVHELGGSRFRRIRMTASARASGSRCWRLWKSMRSKFSTRRRR